MLLVLHAGPSSATDVSADITSTRTWDATGSPYIIKADVHVTDGVTLTIDPRVRVLFDGKFSIYCDGDAKILARTTPFALIEFTSNKANPYRNEWTSVHSGVGGVFENCSFLYGTYALVAEDDAIVRDCEFAKGYTGLDIVGKRVVATGCVFGTVGIGVHLTGSDIRVAGCLVRTSETAGVVFEGAYRSVVENCRVDACTIGVKFMGSTMESALEGCRITYSDRTGIFYQCFGTGNRLANGTVSNMTTGIEVSTGSATQPTELLIYGMRVTECGERGITIYSATTTDSIRVTGCILKSNARGIHVDSRKEVTIAECTFYENQLGLMWGAGYGNGGKICWNNFLNNTVQAQIGRYGPSFDHNGRGSYWSDYTGQDANGDGIGDTPYKIDDIHEDIYPLMRFNDPVAPIADAGPDRTIEQHGLLYLSGANSTDDIEIAHYAWVVDLTGTDLHAYSSEAALRVDEAGMFNVTLVVRDFGGNMGTDTFVLTVLDRDAPSISVVDFVPYATTGDPFEIRCEIVDNIGVTTSWLMYDLGSGGQMRQDLVPPRGGPVWSVVIDVPADQRAAISAVVYASDGAGNTAVTQQLHAEVEDNDRPVVTNMTIAPVTTGDTVSLGCTATDNWDVANVTAECSFGTIDVVNVDLAPFLDRWYCSIQVPGSARSPLLVILRAVDGSGNVVTVRYDPIQVIDNDPPVMSMEPPSETVTGGRIFLGCNVTDNWFVSAVHIEYWYADGDHLMANMTQRETQIEWVYVLEVSVEARSPLKLLFNASDNSGNVRTRTFEIPVIDDRPPTLLQDLAPSTLNKGADELFAALMEDNIGVTEAYLEVKLAGGAWQSMALLGDGTLRQVDVLMPTDVPTLQYRYRARDAAGNELLTEPVGRSLLSQNPRITSVPPRDAYTYEHYSVGLVAIDEDTPLERLFWVLRTNATWLSLDGETGVLSGLPTGHDMGVYWVNVSVVDGAGGSSALVFNLTVHYQNAAPTVAVLDPIAGKKVSGKLSASGTASDVDGSVLWVRARIDGGEWVNVSGTETWSVDLDLKGLKAGEHTLEVMAYDGTDESEMLRVAFVVKESGSGSGIPGLGPQGVLGALALAGVLVGIGSGRARRRGGHEPT